MLEDKFDFRIICQYYYDNNENDYHSICIENGHGYESTNPEDWTEGQRINMLRHIAESLKLNVSIIKK